MKSLEEETKRSDDKKTNSHKYPCVICSSEFIGYSHSTISVCDVRVSCELCNNQVIVERLKQ